MLAFLEKNDYLDRGNKWDWSGSIPPTEIQKKSIMAYIMGEAVQSPHSHEKPILQVWWKGVCAVRWRPNWIAGGTDNS